MFEHSCGDSRVKVNEWVCGDPETNKPTYPMFRESECPAHCQAEMLNITEFNGDTKMTSKGDIVSRHCYMHFCDDEDDWVVRYLVFDKSAPAPSKNIDMFSAKDIRMRL